MKFVDPRNDVAFKKIFGSENRKEILISFLNAVLELQDEHEIVDIDLLNPYQAPKIDILKYTLLDVRAKDRRGVIFIVEMQVDRVPGFQKRFLYYASNAYASQIEQGTDYPRLNQVIFIGILDFAAFEGNNYLTRHMILNTSTYKQEITDLEFNFIELPKFTRQEDELETVLEKWVYFIKYARQLQDIPPNTDAKPLRTAYEVANRFGWSREEMEIYDYWSIKMGDERGRYELAVQEALQKGLQQGIQQGRQEGIQQGRDDERLGIAQRMLRQGYDVPTIADMTGLSMETIASLGEP